MSIPGPDGPAGDARDADRVRLRPVPEADLADLFAHQLDPVAAAMAGFPSRDRSSFMVHWQRILADPSVVARTIAVDRLHR